MSTDPRWLADIVAATTSFVGTADASGRPLWVNEAGRALCGLSSEEPLPASLADFHPARLWPRLDEGVVVAVRDGVWRDETAVLGPAGEEIPVAQVLVAHYDAVGRLEALSAVMQDLRESRRMIGQLRDRARLLAAVGQAVVATDPDGHIEYWNEAAERLYGWTAHEAMGRRMCDLAVSETEQDVAAEIGAALGRGEAWSGVFRARNKDGVTFPAWLAATPAFGDRGELAKIISVATDLSELHAARDQAQRRADQQAALARLGQEILDTGDLDALLQQVCQATAKVLGADLCEVFELAPDRDRLWLRAAAGWDDGSVGCASVPTGNASEFDYTIEIEGPVVVPEADHETRFTVPELLTERGVASGMSVAISSQHGVYGVLGVHSTCPRRFTEEEDAAFLHSVAHLVASAVKHHGTADELEQLALYDALTGLANRALATSRLDEALADTGESGGHVGVVMLDVDGFKLVNDGLGHRHGDQLLQQIAQRLGETARPEELVSRLGSDEFAVICLRLPDDEVAAAAECRQLAHTLCDAVSGHYELSPGMVYVTAGAGVAVSLDHDEGVELLRDAQAAVSTAKERKRGSVCVYDQHMRARAARQIEVASDLRDALARDNFFMTYQAEIDLGTGALFGVEALLRWNHSSRGVLAPAAFLSVAEDSGLIVPLGAQALHRACDDVAEILSTLGDGSSQLAVNVAAAQLSEEDFVQDVDHALAASGLAGHNLMVEITETALINNPATVARTLADLRERGVRVALDDFGTGYSSLTHLAHFPIDVVKIDRSFVAGVAVPGRHRQIVEAVVRLAHTMRLTCVAEGVETSAQFCNLHALGCDVGQGYLWGPPQPVDELAAWLGGKPGP